MKALFSVLLAQAQFAQSNLFTFSGRYMCIVCREVEQGRRCDDFGSNACQHVNSTYLQSVGGCQSLCLSSTTETSTMSTGAGFDVRVAKGFGTKPYNSLRVSIITQVDPSSVFNTSGFEYSSQFFKKWKENFITSTMVAHPSPGGKPLEFPVGNQTISIRLPAQGSGTAGVIIADPCVEHGR